MHAWTGFTALMFRSHDRLGVVCFRMSATYFLVCHMSEGVAKAMCFARLVNCGTVECTRNDSARFKTCRQASCKMVF